MNKRHEEHYRRAMFRITPVVEAMAKTAALKELGFVNYDSLMFMDKERVDRLTAHKLGRRFAS